MNYNAIKSKLLLFLCVSIYRLMLICGFCCRWNHSHPQPLSGMRCGTQKIVNNDYDTYSNIYFPIACISFGVLERFMILRFEHQSIKRVFTADVYKLLLIVIIIIIIFVLTFVLICNKSIILSPRLTQWILMLSIFVVVVFFSLAWFVAINRLNLWMRYVYAHVNLLLYGFCFDSDNKIEEINHRSGDIAETESIWIWYSFVIKVLKKVFHDRHSEFVDWFPVSTRSFAGPSFESYCFGRDFDGVHSWWVVYIFYTKWKTHCDHTGFFFYFLRIFAYANYMRHYYLIDCSSNECDTK